MDPAPRRRSTRDRPAKAPLGEDAIVDAALAIVRRDGLDAVTMRRLAAELDTGPASLYVYFPSARDLRNAMRDRIAGMIELEAPDPARWREQVHALMTQMLATLEAHPGMAAFSMANPPTTEEALLVAENLLACLLAGGLRPRDAAWACDILPLITTSLAVEAAIHAERAATGGEAEMIERLTSAFATLSADRFPHLIAHRAEMISGDGDERFHFAVDTLLDGLVARAARAG